MAQIRTLKLNLLADVSKFGAGMVEARGDVNKLSTSAQRAGKAISAAFAGMSVSAAFAAARISADAIKAASDLNETVTKTQTIFGDTSKEIIDFSKTADKKLGLSKRSALDAASTFAIFGKSAGLSGKDLTNFTKKLVTLSSDFASFFNTSPEEAITAIGAALRGEAEPIRKYGILLSAASLEESAFNYETKTGTELQRDAKNQLTDSAKVIARYQGIVEQSSDAQGDFSRTSEGLANQQRILKAETDNLKASLGAGLLPVMTSIVSAASDIATGFNGGTNSLADSMSAVTREGYYQKSGGENLGTALKNVADSTAKLFGVLKTDGENSYDILNKLATVLNLYAQALGFVADNAKRTKDYAGWLFSGGVLGSIARKVTGARAAGGSVSAGQAYRVGEFGAETFIPNSSGRIVPNAGGGAVTINLNGVIDGESARRSIERLLQDSGRRTAAVNLAGQAL